MKKRWRVLLLYLMVTSGLVSFQARAFAIVRAYLWLRCIGMGRLVRICFFFFSFEYELQLNCFTRKNEWCLGLSVAFILFYLFHIWMARFGCCYCRSFTSAPLLYIECILCTQIYIYSICKFRCASNTFKQSQFPLVSMHDNSWQLMDADLRLQLHNYYSLPIKDFLSIGHCLTNQFWL